MNKKSRTAAAVIAAVMAMSCAAVPAFAEGSTVSAAEEAAVTGTLSGGWQTNTGNLALSKDPAAKAAFRKAVKGLTGVSYKAIALLGTQVVAGTNYAILCRSTVVYPGAQPGINILYIYEDLEGNAQILGTETIIGGTVPGGFSANTGKFSMSANKSVKSAFSKAINGLTGVSYTPVAYLGEQVVAGSNYLMLCRSRAVYPNAPYKWSLVTVYKDLRGKASIGNIETLELGIPCEDDGEGEESMMQIANPWQEHGTVAEASQAAGIEDFTVPAKLGRYELTYIQAMDGLADVRYSDGNNTIYIRKGVGTDDISGDYNTYKNVREKKIGAYTVTLKGNGKGVNCAVWTDGDHSFSVYSGKALSESSAETIIRKIG